MKELRGRAEFYAARAKAQANDEEPIHSPFGELFMQVAWLGYAVVEIIKHLEEKDS